MHVDLFLFSLLCLFAYAKKKSATSRTVRVCTWNINGVIQNSHTLQERFSKIDTWWSPDLKPDIVCLQEVFKFTNHGVNNVAFVENYFSSRGFSNQVHGGQGPLESSGLLTVSNHGLEFVHFEPFSKKRSYDVLAHKGFLDCTIQGTDIHVVNVHMQSIMSKRDWTMLWMTQKVQLDQLLRYVEKLNRVILCGDFNIRSDTLLGAFMHAKLAMLGFKKVLAKKESNFFYENEYLDQIWVRGCMDVQPLATLSEKTLVSSDHIPVFAEIVF